MKRRHAILLLGGASSGAMSVGTGAFSSVEADRGVEVSVVDDDEAYLGLEQVGEYLPISDDVQTTGGYEPNDVVLIKNQFSDPLDLTVTIDSTDGVVGKQNVEMGDPLDAGSELGIGQEAFVAVNCDETGSGHVTLFFDGEAGGATVEKTRQFSVSCLDVEFNGENGEGNGDNGGGTVHVSGFSGTLDVIKNGGPDTETISSKGNGPGVVTPDDDRIDSVTIDGVVYERDGNDET